MNACESGAPHVATDETPRRRDTAEVAGVYTPAGQLPSLGINTWKEEFS